MTIIIVKANRWLSAYAAAILVVVPLASAAPVEDIAFVSHTSISQDRPELDLLRARLREAGFEPPGIHVHHWQVAVDAAIAKREIEERLRHTPVRLLIAASMSIAQTAHELDPKLPIVFDGAADPVRMCLAESLAVPGKKVTGHTTAIPAEAKMLEALHDAYPHLSHWLVLVDGQNDDSGGCAGDGDHAPPAALTPCTPGPIANPSSRVTGIEVASVRQLAAQHGKRVTFYRLCSISDFSMFASMLASEATGVAVPLHYLFYEHAQEIVGALNRARLRAVYARWFYAEMGGLMAVSPRGESTPMATTLELALQVLKGADPGTLPIQVPSGFSFWMNVKTARELGAKPSLQALIRADRLLD